MSRPSSCACLADMEILSGSSITALLQETLNEEEATDRALTKIAETAVNQEAEAA